MAVIDQEVAVQALADLHERHHPADEHAEQQARP